MTDGADRAGIWLDLRECKVLFSRLKGMETRLSAPERELLLRIEKTLYERLSIGELETLQSFPLREDGGDSGRPRGRLS